MNFKENGKDIESVCIYESISSHKNLEVLLYIHMNILIYLS